MSFIENKIKISASRTDAKLYEYFKDFDSDSKVLFDAMNYSVTAGGKRIRPFLVMQLCDTFSGRSDEALIYASAIEMIHTYSLIHDDLPCMDNDDLRRGKPTCHKVYSEASALLAGDALLTYAFEIVANAQCISDKNKVEAIKILSEASGRYGMIGGQQIDLSGEKGGMSYELMAKMHSLKTGALIKCACRLGTLSADVSDSETLEKIDCYAEGIGRVFQLVDDILDVQSSSEELGKPTHSDEKNEKTTYLSFMSIEMARQLALAMTEKAIESVSSFDRGRVLEALASYLCTRKK